MAYTLTVVIGCTEKGVLFLEYDVMGIGMQKRVCGRRCDL